MILHTYTIYNEWQKNGKKKSKTQLEVAGHTFVLGQILISVEKLNFYP